MAPRLKQVKAFIAMTDRQHLTDLGLDDLNIYWMPAFALTPVDQIQSTDVRRAASAIEWTSSGVKRNALIKLGTVLKAAMHDGLIKRNPLDSIERPRQVRKQVDPFTVDEAEQIIGHLYANDHWPTRIYAAYFEFAFYTGMRPAEIMALDWMRWIPKAARPTFAAWWPIAPSMNAPRPSAPATYS